MDSMLIGAVAAWQAMTPAQWQFDEGRR